jgi:cholesterol oxidase
MAPAGSAYDVIVIGSGFGGAVTSCRLAEAGLRVLILERGRRWGPDTFPRKPGDPWVWDQAHPEKKNGWLDFRAQRGVSVAQGAGVGGGSLIYANVVIEPPEALFASGWPERVTFAELKPYYRRVDAMLKPRIVPEQQLNARFRLLREAGAAIGHAHRFRPMPLAVTFDDEWREGAAPPPGSSGSRTWINEHGREQGTCVHCGNCYLGCQVNARNTLDLTYIARAESHGAEVRPLHVVRRIAPSGTGYRVDYHRIEHGQLVPGSATADRVIVSAGSLGSTELLLRCRDQFRTLPDMSAALGSHWSANGDFLSISIQQQPVHPTKGPTITAALDFLDEGAHGGRFFVQDGGFPDFFRAIVEGDLKFDFRNLQFSVMVFSLAWVLRRQGQLAQMMPWFGQSIDASDGRLYLGRSALAPWRRKLKLDWNVHTSKATIDAMVAMHRELASATGGRILAPLLWTLLRTLVTPHPLGGCRMADTPASGVVDHRGEVFGYRNLFVADGSVIPRAIGLNPSKTIAAVSERIAAHILQQVS